MHKIKVQILSYSDSFHRNRVQKIGQFSILSLQPGDKVVMLMVSTIEYLYLYLFICHTITIITKKCQKKNVGRNGEEA